MSNEFKSDSRILEISTGDEYAGIVLDSLEDISNALAECNGSKVKSIIRVQRELLESSYSERTGIVPNPGFASELETAVLSKLKTSGRYRSIISDEGFGTNFFETMLNIEKVKDKYVFSISTYGKNEETNIELSDILKKPIALKSADIALFMSTFSDGSFSIDLKDVFSGLFFPEEKLAGYADFILEEYCESILMNEEPLIVTPGDNNLNFRMKVGLSLNPAEKEICCAHCDMRAEDTRLIGSAYSFVGDSKRAYLPELVLSISVYDKGLERPTLTRREENETTAFRESFVDIIKERHF